MRLLLPKGKSSIEMPPRCPTIQGTLTPFLYPFLIHNTPRLTSRTFFATTRKYNEVLAETSPPPPNEVEVEVEEPAYPQPEEGSHLNPPPTDYARSIFSDKASITIHAGHGGHGCISFLREKYIAAGPPNGGDGGTGGNIYIQAVRSETSLHKLSRRSILKAGRGQNGQGKTRGGERGDDVIIEVPVGTVIREIERMDPILFEEEQRMLQIEQEERAEREVNEASDAREEKEKAAIPEGGEEGEYAASDRARARASAMAKTKGPWKWDRQKWLLYPAVTPEDIATADFPKFPKPRKSTLSMQQVKGPISLDLSKPMDRPLLLAAGAVGGLGNPHFVSRTMPRPKYASKGSEGLSIVLELELKLLADVGLVGLPNAGKSTLLRAMSASRARVGNWAFTTLQPNIGTVVLDNQKGRPIEHSTFSDGTPRTNFTIADIPGLVKDAHLDRGLGISFLRHVERARVLAFVIDLNAGDAVEALKALWTELSAYEQMKIAEEAEKVTPGLIKWTPFVPDDPALQDRSEAIVIDGVNKYDASEAPSIAGKPWFVVATKADLPGTRERFQALKSYLERVESGEEEHPSKQTEPWKGKVEAVPVSAINGHGVERIRSLTVGLLDD